MANMPKYEKILNIYKNSVNMYMKVYEYIHLCNNRFMKIRIGEFMKRFKRILTNEIGGYLFFGICTTIVNYLTFGFFYKCVFVDMPLIANTIAFISATTFAYVTNKLFVFKSLNCNLKDLLVEVFSFLSARILSFAFEQVGLYLAVEYLWVNGFVFMGMDRVMIFKVVLSIIVVFINYFISKLLIFK